jgi:hypothetical protein
VPTHPIRGLPGLDQPTVACCSTVRLQVKWVQAQANNAATNWLQLCY